MMRRIVVIATSNGSPAGKAGSMPDRIAKSTLAA